MRKLALGAHRPRGAPRRVRPRAQPQPTSAFFGTALESLLHSYGADTLLLSGLSANNAISAAARDAFACDIPVVVVREATGAAPSRTELETSFVILETWTAEVASGEDVLARLRR